jgi:hypothetical protein
MCDSCGAVQCFKAVPRRLNFANFDDDAPYVFTLLSHFAYLLSAPRISPWAQVRGFQLEATWFDFLHVSPLGIERDSAGSILIDLLESDLLGPVGCDPDQALKRVWVQLRHWSTSKGMCAPTGTAFSLVSLGRGQSALVFPELSSSFKAMAVRTVSVFLADLCYKLDAGDRNSKLRSACTWGLAEMHHVFNTGGLVLTREEAARARHGGLVHLRSYLLLAHGAIQRGRRLYKLRPKHHSLWHICHRLSTLRLNPWILSCLRGEDALGRFKKVARRCHARTASKRFLTRWMAVLCEEWGRPDVMSAP